MPLTIIPATSNDIAGGVRNGVYSIGDGTSRFTFKIHTITTARTQDLIGKRVVSRMMDNGGYQAFGFLTTTGDLRMWQRFAADENAPYAKFCRSLLRFCREDLVSIDNYILSRGYWRTYAGVVTYQIDFGFLCRVCNGGLATEDDRIEGVHFNGVCTTELSPTQLRDVEAREEAAREAERIRQRQAQALAEVVEMRRTGRGTFSDVPDSIVANLPCSQINPSVIR